MRIAIVGGGYVGLVSGACLAAHGHDIVIVESDPNKVKSINQGNCPIFEAGLPELLEKTVGKNLKVTDRIEDAITGSDATFIAVGTPFDGDSIDLTQIEQAARDVGGALKNTDRYHLVVVKSTVVPGTTDNTVAKLLEQHSGKKLGVDFGLGMNPEFLKEGTAVKDFMTPDRIVLGGNDAKAQEKLAQIYGCFAGVDKVRVNNTTAEMIKYASNALLATLISFSNEIGNLCSRLPDTDVTAVLDGVCLDKRLSPIMPNGDRVTPEITSYLAAGCGFGGSCFPKDVNALRKFSQQQGVNSTVLDAVIDTNKKQAELFVQLLIESMPNLRGKNVAILGLAFKPGTDDTRESPAIAVIRQLLKTDAQLVVYDPIVERLPDEISSSDISIAKNLRDAASRADAILLITAWDEFRGLADLLNALSRQPLVVDGRRFLNAEDFEHYRGIGLGPQTQDDGSDEDKSGKPDDKVASAA